MDHDKKLELISCINNSLDSCVRSFKETRDECDYYRKVCWDIIVNDKLPDRYEVNSDYLMLRDPICSYLSWCLVSNSWLDILYNKILKGKKCIELYAGRGLISHHLQKRGCDITPYDDNSWGYLGDYVYTGIINKDTREVLEDIKSNQNIDFILTSWIPLNDDSCSRILKYMKYKNPKCRLIYIGENMGGCNASDEFFENAIEDEKYSKVLEEINDNYQRWRGIYDSVYIFKAI